MLHCAACSYDLCSSCGGVKEQQGRSMVNLEEEGPLPEGSPMPSPEWSPLPMSEWSPITMPGATQRWGPMPSSPWSPGLPRGGSPDMLPGGSPAPQGAAHLGTAAWISRQNSAGPGAAMFAAFVEGAQPAAASAPRDASPQASPIRPATSHCAGPMLCRGCCSALALGCGGAHTSQGTRPTQKWGSPLRRCLSLSPTLSFGDATSPERIVRRSPSVPVLERKRTLSPTQICQRHEIADGLEHWRSCKRVRGCDRVTSCQN